MELDESKNIQYSIFMNSDNFIDYTNRINLAFSKTDQSSIKKVLFTLNQSFESDARIWIAGNGGSAATASHFATDLSRCKNSRYKPIKGISLCDNSGLITAISNDFGYEYIFSRQLSNLATSGDLLVVLSASGNSKNILEVLGWAKNNQVKTIALTGFDGGEANKMADISLHIPTEIGDYGVAEDTHSIICHFLSSQFK
jgi:D-sedoheptulose 7-phosphate isomerase